MFRINWQPTIIVGKKKKKIPPDSLYRLWQDYVKETNNRQRVHEDDDKWGINTYVLGQHFGSRKELATNTDAGTEVFRERLITLLENKKLCMPDEVAIAVYGEQSVVENEKDLAQLGVIFDINIAVDLTAMVTVQKSDPHFDYFFVCKLLQIKIVDIGPFLEYQLRESFERDADVFRVFLSSLTIQYSPEKSGKIPGMPIIAPEIKGLIMDRIEGLKNANFQKINTPDNMEIDQSSSVPSDNTAAQQETFPKWSNRQWAVFITVSLETFGLNIKSEDHVSNVARMLSLILGKEVKDIGSAELYKRISEVLTLKNPQKLNADFDLVKTYFQKVKWTQAIEKIDLKINELANKNKKIKS